MTMVDCLTTNALNTYTQKNVCYTKSSFVCNNLLWNLQCMIFWFWIYGQKLKKTKQKENWN